MEGVLHAMIIEMRKCCVMPYESRALSPLHESISFHCHKPQRLMALSVSRHPEFMLRALS